LKNKSEKLLKNIKDVSRSKCYNYWMAVYRWGCLLYISSIYLLCRFCWPR